MNTTTHRAFLAGPSLAGAQGFAVAFAALGLIGRVVSINVTDANMQLALTILLYGAAGALGSAYLASTMEWKGILLLFALGGILGCGGGYLVTWFLFIRNVEPDITYHTTIEAAYILQHVLIGAALGAFLGIATGSPRRLLFLVVAGAVGFGIGYLMQTSLNDLLAEPLSDFVGSHTDSDSINLIAASLLWGLGSGLCGLMGGGVLGYAFEF